MIEQSLDELRKQIRRNRKGIKMEIIRDKKNIFISTTRTEAMQIIKSIISQIISNSANAGRKEFYTDKQEYLSISVTPEKNDLK